MKDGAFFPACFFTLESCIYQPICSVFCLQAFGLRRNSDFVRHTTGFVRIEPLHDLLQLNSNLLNLAVKIGFLCMLSDFGGSLLSFLHLQESGVSTVSVDASSALFGLLGAMLSELLTNWSIYANKVLYIISQYWKTVCLCV